MNVVGFYLSNPLAYCFTHDGLVAGTGLQGFERAAMAMAYQFGGWISKQDIDEYDILAVYAPAVIHPDFVPLYRWFATKWPAKVALVRPHEIRTWMNLETPTMRDYLRYVRRNNAVVKIRSWEEAVATLAASVAGNQAHRLPSPRALCDRGLAGSLPGLPSRLAED